MPDLHAQLVIAGGGLAAQRCCETLRTACDERTIAIVSNEAVAPYDRPPLSKQLDGGAPVFRSPDWYADNDVELVLGRAAQRLDVHARRLELAGGTTVGYGHLLIATGSEPRVLPLFEGVENAQALRTFDDARRLRAAIAAGGPLAIVGAGLIGLEAAATARKAGLDATVIEAGPAPVSGLLGEAVSAWLVRLHRDAGVRLRFGTTVTARRDGELVLDDGARVPAAHVLVGVGVRPATDWLGPAGIPNAAGVHAAGDVTGGGHWEAAARAGAAVARELLGRPPAPPAAPAFWSDQHGIRLNCVGNPRGAESVAVDGDPETGRFTATYHGGGRATAVLLAGASPADLRAARRRLDPIPLEATGSTVGPVCCGATYAARGTARARLSAQASLARIVRSACSRTRSSPRTRSGASAHSCLRRPNSRSTAARRR